MFCLLNLEDHYMVLNAEQMKECGKIHKKKKRSDTFNKEGAVEYEEASYFVVGGSEQPKLCVVESK